ncbi:MAG: RHS repeat protein, partial [Deltaproteobacteria bacterium]|nr:RHS repeat protein [Deltaproteobacteria bacterium]
MRSVSIFIMIFLCAVTIDGHASAIERSGDQRGHSDRYEKILLDEMGLLQDATRMDGVAKYIGEVGADYLRGAIFNRAAGWIIESVDELKGLKGRGESAEHFISALKEDAELSIQVRKGIERRIRDQLHDIARRVIADKIFGDISDGTKMNEALDIADRATREIETNMGDRIDAIAGSLFTSVIERMDEIVVSQMFDAKAELQGVNDLVSGAFAQGDISDNISRAMGEMIGEGAVSSIRQRIRESLEGSLSPDLLNVLTESPKALEEYLARNPKNLPMGSLDEIANSVLNFPSIKFPTPAYASILAASAAGHFARAFKGVFVDPYELRRGTEVVRVMVWQIENKEAINLSLMQIGSIVDGLIPNLNLSLSVEGLKDKLSAPLDRINKLNESIEGMLSTPFDEIKGEVAGFSQEMIGSLEEVQSYLNDQSILSVREDVKNSLADISSVDDVVSEFSENILDPMASIGEDILNVDGIAFDEMSSLGPLADIVDEELIPSSYLPFSKELDPVLLHNGEYYSEITDLMIPGVGIDFKFTRIYRGASRFLGELGWRWTHSYAERVLPWKDGFTYIDGEGRKFYIKKAAGKYIPPPELFVDFKVFPSGGYSIRADDGIVTKFNNLGLPMEKEDRYKNRIEFRYNRNGLLKEVLDTYGRSIILSRRDDGLIDSIEDYVGRKVSFKYNKHKELIGVSTPVTDNYPQGKSTAYRYERGHDDLYRSHLITMVVDPKGQVFLKNRYDSKGRVTEQQYGERPWVKVRYGEDGIETSVMDSMGVERLYQHDECGHIVGVYKLDAGERILIRSYGYDEMGRRMSACQPSGRCVRYSYDNSFRWPVKIETVPPDGERSRIITIKRESVFGRPLRIVDATGRATAFYYSKGWPHDLIRTSSTLKSDSVNRIQELYSYNGCGMLIEHVDSGGYSRKYEYYPSKDPDGDLNLVNSSRFDDVTACGYLKSIDDGGVESFKYDPVGNVLAIERRDSSLELFGVNNLNQIVAEDLPGEAPRLYAFDANDNMIRSITVDGDREISQRLEYDVLDNLTVMQREVSEGVFASTQYRYDQLGRLVGITYPEGNRKEYEYYWNDRLKCIVRGAGTLTMSKECYEYDIDGDVLREIDGIGAVTSFERNDFGEVTAIIDPLGNKEMYRRNGGGRVVEKTHRDSMGVLLSKTEYEYGIFNRPVREIKYLWNNDCKRSRRVVTQYDYNNSGYVVAITDPAGGVTQFKRDRYGRVVSIVDATSVERTFVRDALGNITDEYFNSDGEKLKLIRREFDDAGRLLAYNYGTGESWRMTYDGVGNIVSIQNPYEAKTEYVHDDLGRTTSVVRKIDGETLVSKYVWNLNGDLVKAVNALDEEIDYSYDALGRLVLEKYYDGSKRRLIYDDADNIVGIVGRGGRSISIVVDKMGQVISRSATAELSWIPHVKQKFEYDGMGRLLKAVDGDVENNFIYDSMSRRIAEKNGKRWTINGYSDLGELISLRDPVGRTFYRTYDAAGRLKGVLYDKKRILSFYYDATGGLKEQSFGDDMSLEIEGDRWGRVLQRNYFRGNGISMGWHEIHRDDQGGVDFEIGRYDVKRKFERDPLGRLVGVVDSAKHSENSLIREWLYDLDDLGNVVNDHVVEYDSGQVIGIDDRVFKYDALGRLVWTMSGTVYTDYSYDAFDRLVGVSTNGIQKSFTWSDWNLLVEDAPQESFTYVHYDGSNAPLAYIGAEDVSYFQTDRLGSVTGVVTGDGKKMAQCEYDPYGNRYECEDFNRPFCFTGQICDGDPNLIYMRYRHYDPVTGRFLTPDPLGLKMSLHTEFNVHATPGISYHKMQGGASHLTFANRSSSVSGGYGVYPFNRTYYDGSDQLGGELNLYLYAKADPSRYVDPLGLASLIFDRSDERIYLRDRNEVDIMEFRATNYAANPIADPFLVGGNGPFPDGSYPVSVPRFYSEEYRRSFYERYELGRLVPGESRANGKYWKKYPQDKRNYSIAFGRVRLRAGFGVGEAAWERQLFIHGGRHNYRARTLGCIRVDDRDLDDMAALYIIH